jgi:uncharacterized alkaline shock family protein YloU
MKARSGKLGDFLMTLLLLGIGAGLVYGSLFRPELGRTISDLLAIPLVAAGLGAILILSVVLRWVGGCGRKKEAYIDFQSEDGSVGISTKAIQDFIERVGREFAAVKSIESRLIQARGGLDIVVGVRVVSGNKIPELSQVLQQRIRESVRESLGLESIGRITVRVKEIIGVPDKPVPTRDDLENA